MLRVAMRGVAGIAAVFGILVVSVGLAVYLPQAEGLRREVAEQALTRLWGEPVVIRGSVDMSLWPRPAMMMADVEAQGTEGARAHVGRLVFSLPVYARLIAGNGLRYGLALDDARFAVPLDGAENARPGSLLASPIHVLSLLPHLVIHDTTVRFTDAGRGWDFELKVAALRNQLEAGRSVLAADAALNGRPVSLDFAFDLDAEAAEGSRPYAADIRLVSGDLSARFDVRAPTRAFDHDLAMAIDAEAGSLVTVLRLAGIAPSIDGTGRLRARLDVDPDRVGLADLDLALTLVGGEHIAVTGHSADMATLQGTDIRVVADLAPGAPAAVSLRDIVITRLSGAFRSRGEGMMLDDILIATNAFTQSLREIGPIRVRSVTRDAEGHVALRGISVRAGPGERPIARLKGNVDDILGLAGIELDGDIDIPVASMLELPPETGNKLGRVVGTLAVSDAGGGLGVDTFSARIDGSDLVEARLALVLDELGKRDVAATTQVDARLKVPNYSAFAAAFGDSSGFRGPLAFDGRLSGTLDALTMDGRTDIGRTRIEGALTSSAAPAGRTLVKGTIRSPLVYADELLTFLRPDGRRRRTPVAVVGASAPAGGSQIDLVGTTDADVAISAARLQGGGDRATGVEAQLQLKSGALRVSPLRIRYRGGTISAVLASEGRSVLRARGTGQGWPLASLFAGSDIPVSGTLRVTFDLTTRIDAGDPLAALGGTLTARVGRGRIGTGLLDLAGVGIVAGIFTSSVQKGESVLRCAKVPLVFSRGVGRTSPVIVVETDNVQALGRGTVDLVRNRIDLRVAPRPINSPDAAPGHSFTVKGPLTSPDIALASGGGDPQGRYGCE